MKKTLIALLGGLAFISCDEENTIYYKINNQTADTLRVSFTFKDNYMDNQPTDTTMIVASDASTIIFEAIQWSPRVYKPDGGPTMTFFENMTITNGAPGDTLLIDVYRSSNWRYHETSHHTAEYRLDLTDEHFGQQ